MDTALRSKETTAAKRESPWDQARRKLLKRTNSINSQPEPIDRGVNYFLLQLERLGLSTEWSCEGHPAGFYLIFSANYAQALIIKCRGYFVVEIIGVNHWRLGFSYPQKSIRARNQTLRWAANSWESAFGSLDTPASPWPEIYERLLTNPEG